ncbi:hypothetical protein [Methanospirillum lacunae]|nr:hypothetical protein [Methanospirillum lacunae]
MDRIFYWNYGKRDDPGKIMLFHEDVTQYGPWETFGKNGTKNEQNVYLVSNPGDVLKPRTEGLRKGVKREIG